MLLQLIQDATAINQTVDWPSVIGGGTIGTIASQLVGKWINRKKDKEDVSSQQAQLLKTVNEDLKKVIDQLISLSCYKEKCKQRINGEEPTP